MKKDEIYLEYINCTENPNLEELLLNIILKHKLNCFAKQIKIIHIRYFNPTQTAQILAVISDQIGKNRAICSQNFRTQLQNQGSSILPLELQPDVKCPQTSLVSGANSQISRRNGQFRRRLVLWGFLGNYGVVGDGGNPTRGQDPACKGELLVLLGVQEVGRLHFGLFVTGRRRVGAEGVGV